MTESVLSTVDTTTLRQRFAAITEAYRDTLGTLVDQAIQCTPGDVELLDAATVRGDEVGVVLRLDLADDGAALWIRMALPDALAINALLVGANEEAIAESRAKASWDDEDRESFDPVAKALGAAIEGAMSPAGEAGAQVRETRHGSDDDLLDGAQLAGCRMALQIAELPESTAWLLLDQGTAETWNGAPVASGDDAPRREETFEEIPEAPIQGVLNSYLVDRDAWPILRRSCRRVGLELRHRSRAEVPNPAAHRGEFVLMDVPRGEERRFDWCKRLKNYEGNIRVVLIIHAPSRARVIQGFLAGADVIVGWPLEESELSPRLAAALVGEVPVDDEGDSPAE